MRTCCALALVAVVGCDFGSLDVQTLDNSCVDGERCEQGICDSNICIDDSGASVDVAIEVLRGSNEPEGTTPASWAFASESFSGASTRDLVLPATREIVGVVRWNGLPIPATLRFVRRMPEPVALLTPTAVEVHTLREAAAGDGLQSYDFSTVLVAAETYDVVVLPNSDMVMTSAEASMPAIRSLPPLYLELSIDDGDASEPFRFDVAFPADLADGCADENDVGCTLEAEVLSVNGELKLPEAGLQVRAIDKKTSRVVSSIGETDDNGHFAIRISGSATGYLVRVTSSVGRDPFPAVSVDPEVVFAGDPTENRIYIPRLTPVQFAGRVRDMDDSPVPGATVRFLSTGIFGGNELGLEGSFSGSATTDDEGVFGAELLPGFYSIVVIPPQDVENTWGVLTSESLVGGDVTGTEALVVPSQFELRGRVVTFRDEPASGVTVLARARPSSGLVATHRSQEVVTGDLGAFGMSVDAGLYDMHVKASPETGFGWLVDPELVMSSDLVRTYRLKPPIPLRGVLRNSDGVPVPDALVRAYVLTSVEGAASRSIQVAETVSAEDGSYRLLIAPRVGGE